MAYVRMGGLPYQLTVDQAIGWFKERGINGIQNVHLLLNRDSRPSGMGFAVFASDEAADSAMELDGKDIGDYKRYVKLYRSSGEECEWYLQRQKRQQREGGLHLVRMGGLPYKISEYEISKWFKKVEANCIDVQLGVSRNTHGLANAYFESEAEAAKALKMNKENMEGRYIELYMDKVLVTFDGDGGKFSLRMKGVPYRATEQELKDFFKPATTCTEVKVVLNRNGVPSGDAIASFASQEDLDAAMTCDKKHLGSRYVVLEAQDGSSAPRRRQSGSQSENKYPFALKMNGLPYNAAEEEVMSFFEPVAKCTHVTILKNRTGRPSGEAIAAFATKEDAESAMSKNRDYLGSRYVVLSQYD